MFGPSRTVKFQEVDCRIRLRKTRPQAGRNDFEWAFEPGVRSRNADMHARVQGILSRDNLITNVLHASWMYCSIAQMRESFPLPALNFITQQHHNTAQQYPLLPHQNSISPVAENASHVPSSRPVFGVQPSQAAVIPSGLPQQHAQPQAAPLRLSAQQAAAQERIPPQNADDKQIFRAPNSPSEVLDHAAPSVQAPRGILSPPPHATDAAAAAMPLEALVSPDEGGPSAPRTDGGKTNLSQTVSNIKTVSKITISIKHF
uniref:Uncharacterized protein n=1 Tax=Chromera velia CCMP2878 TaxID=1169474 RepID=A0A0G4HKT5_9ALVE|eukprot:Cvel_28577.t1-p1 / transcript=Cvel_28577.t1 / gene=Cvel_28577 / organism=Chromera_velia_CCMP2878 / gene_product=hypothetical protein / transcript_product=hypothetical protein / location=Cvel_scaffold3765:11027-11800(+) / protein_length=258 / sequence_SO=supercontig / SO=protein_coding / is_pseudo=false